MTSALTDLTSKGRGDRVNVRNARAWSVPRGTQSREGGAGAVLIKGRGGGAPRRGCGHREEPRCVDAWGTQGRGSRQRRPVCGRSTVSWGQGRGVDGIEIRGEAGLKHGSFLLGRSSYINPNSSPSSSEEATSPLGDTWAPSSLLRTTTLLGMRGVGGGAGVWEAREGMGLTSSKLSQNFWFPSPALDLTARTPSSCHLQDSP